MLNFDPNLSQNLQKKDKQDTDIPISKTPIITGRVNKKVGWMIYKPRQMILFDNPPILVYYDPENGIKKVKLL